MDRPTPEQYTPEITRGGQLARLAAMLLVSVFTWMWVLPDQWADTRHLFWLDVGAGALAYGLVYLRRRWPLGIAVVVNLLGVVSGVATGPSVLATVSLATRRVWWECAFVGTLLIACITGYYAVQPTEGDEPTWVFALMAVTVAVTQIGWGMFIGSRRELIWALQRRAERAEAERDLRVAQARTLERARIAREMHDVLAHRISHVSLHAGAMAFRDDLDLDELRANAELIQASANEALTELRSVLGVLRDDDDADAPGDGPQPTYDDVRELVDDARAVGVEVDFVDDLAPSATVPATAGRTVYRIVQEGITNARKHAPGAPVTVRVAGDPGAGITVDLANPLGPDARRPSPPPGAGLGLVGLGERAHLRGGTLQAGPENGVFRLNGWLPWAP